LSITASWLRRVVSIGAIAIAAISAIAALKNCLVTAAGIVIYKAVSLFLSHVIRIGILLMHCEKHPEPQLLSVQGYLPMYGGESAGF
jgi:hypothetical protein